MFTNHDLNYPARSELKNILVVVVKKKSVRICARMKKWIFRAPEKGSRGLSFRVCLQEECPKVCCFADVSSCRRFRCSPQRDERE